MRNRGSFQLVTGPQQEPVNASDFAVHHLKVDFLDDAGFIADQLAAAREYLEGQYETCFITQTWKYVLDFFPGAQVSPWYSSWLWPIQSWIEIPKAPMQSVTSITYIDPNGNPQTMPSANYVQDMVRTPPRIGLASGQAWPATNLQVINSVTILGNYGYGDTPGQVPARARQAIRLVAAHFYENREENVIAQRIRPLELPLGARRMMDTLDWRSKVA